MVVVWLCVDEEIRDGIATGSGRCGRAADVTTVTLQVQSKFHTRHLAEPKATSEALGCGNSASNND